MIKVKCTNEIYIGDGEFKRCDFTLEKPRWEHIIYTLRINGGCAYNDICPKCGYKNFGNRSTLVYDFVEEEK